MNKRLKDADWAPGDETGNAPTWERAGIAILLDLRDELKKLNTLMHCHNTLAIPALLRRIATNTAKPKKKRAVRK